MQQAGLTSDEAGGQPRLAILGPRGSRQDNRLVRQVRGCEARPIQKGKVLTVDDIIEAIVPGGRAMAIGVGVGVALLLTRGFRPLAKQAVKGYLVASEGVRRAASGAREGLQDIYAEAKAEQQGGAQPQAPGAGPQVPGAGPQP